MTHRQNATYWLFAFIETCLLVLGYWAAGFDLHGWRLAAFLIWAGATGGTAFVLADRVVRRFLC